MATDKVTLELSKMQFWMLKNLLEVSVNGGYRKAVGERVVNVLGGLQCNDEQFRLLKSINNKIKKLC